jgi:hypothetical protein
MRDPSVPSLNEALPSIPLNTEQDIARLLRINYEVVESLTGKKLPVNSRMWYTEALAWKLFGHAITAFHLWRDHTKLDVVGFESLKQSQSSPAINFVDWSSIEVLARACAEVVIAFDYVYITPSDEDESEFRYLAWMLAGFTQRESFPVLTPEGRKQVTIDAKVNVRQRKRIQVTSAFGALSNDQKQQVLQGRSWHPNKSLTSMFEDVFGPIWGRALYAFMSSHAHSDALSAVQVLQTGEKSKSMAEAAMITISITLAHLTAGYARTWVAARKVYKAHQYRELNEFYLGFGDRDPAHFGF